MLQHEMATVLKDILDEVDWIRTNSKNPISITGVLGGADNIEDIAELALKELDGTHV